MTKLVTANRAYVHFNPLVIQDLATSQPLLTNPWDEWKINHPSHLHLPYANILLLWNSLTSRWYYPTPSNTFNSPTNSPPLFVAKFIKQILSITLLYGNLLH